MLFQIEYLNLYKGGLSIETLTVGEFPVYAALLMLALDACLYMLLAVYFEIAVGGAPTDRHVFLVNLHSGFFYVAIQYLARNVCRVPG